MSGIMKLFSGFKSSSPVVYYHSQYFTQRTSRIFHEAKIANEMKVNTQNPNIDLASRTLLVIPSSRRYSTSSDKNLSASRLLLIMLLITAVGISLTNEAHAAELSQLERVSSLLEKNPAQRTVEEKITLFNALLSLGITEADKAKGKDVVLVFGNTGAGKSTLINYIYELKMVKDGYGGIIVDPNFPITEVTKIGTGSHSCTSIPQAIPDISFHITGDRSSQPKEVSIKCFDMPGITDDRGIEVALANLIIMQHIIEKAQSVRPVMVFEESQLTAERGHAWKKAVNLLSERFDGNIGKGEKNLCLVITKGRNDIPTVQNMIKKYTPDGCLDLSEYATVYDPLNIKDRGKLLNTLYQTKSHQGLGANIALGGDQLWEALMLGEQIQQEIRNDLAKANGVGIDKAVNKIRFTHEIKKLKNTDLAKPHESAEKAVREYAEKIIENMKPSDQVKIDDQIKVYKEYQSVKGRFELFVGFEAFDKSVRDIRLNTKDPRDIAWDKPTTSLLSAALTAGAIGIAIVTAPVTAPVSVVAAAAATAYGFMTTYSLKHWIWPSQEEKDLSEFLKK